MSGTIPYRGYGTISGAAAVEPARSKCAGFRRHYGMRLFKSRWASLVLLWYLLISLSSFNTASVFDKLSYSLPERSAYSQLLFSGVVAFAGALCPALGYIADVYVGRYKVIVALSVILTIGQVSGAVQLILSALNHYTHHSTAALLLLLPSFVMTRVGLDTAGSFIVIFGMDQLKDAPSDELVSYIFWYVGVERVGSTINGMINIFMSPYKSYHLENATLSIVMALVMWCFLWLNNRFAYRRYHREPLSNGSYKQTLQILRFAVAHKYPLHRSAWTYCEDGKISRIDLGKSRYGGPFTTEQVEDVKTLLWMLLIVGISCLASLPLQAQFDNFVSSRFSLQMRWKAHTEADSVAHVMNTLVGIVVATGHELVVFPLLRRRFPSVLRRLGMCLCMFIATPLFYLLIDLVADRHDNFNVCMFQSPANGTAFLQNATSVLNEYTILLPIIASGATYTVFHCTLLELIIAQSPEHFKSMLVGLMMAFIELRNLAFQVISQPFAAAYGTLVPRQSPEDFSCDSVFYLVLVAIGLVALVLYCAASKKYVYRRRDDVIINEHMYAEDYYSQGSA